MPNIPDHAERDHAPFSPSSLKYVAGCAGYEGRSGTSAAAEKGTRIHEALEIRDPSALHDEDEVEIYDKIVLEEAEFNRSYFGETSFEEMNEIKVHVDLGKTSTWGTCDRFLVAGNRAVMADYKTGVSPIDSPKENWQAKAYTLGAFQAFPDVEEILFVFYIPVREEVLHDTFTRADISKLKKELSDIILKAEEVRPKWEAGAPQLNELKPTVNCRFCKYEDVCPSLGGLAIDIASKVSEDTIPKGDIDNPEDPETLEQLWNIAKIVSNWADRIKKKAVAVAKEGKEFPSLSLKSMGSPRSCKDNKKLIEIAADFDMPEEDVLNMANIPLRKVADMVGKTAQDGEKRQKANDFLDALEEADIVKISQERFTLS
tara:strand:- start:2122 stop:3240 length:1119 start_codon:yes stop_codon:yes gene_type:complete